MTAPRVAVVAGPGAPPDAAGLVASGAAAPWDAARVLLVVDAPADVQRRWLAALGRGGAPGTAVALYAPHRSVSELAAAHPHPARVVGFDFLPGRLAPGNLVEVAPGLRTDAAAADAVEAFFRARSAEVERVADFAGLVLRRVLFTILNEAAYAVWEGVASRDDLDLAMKLGTGYPEGPLAWADAIGLDRVYEGLRAMHEELGDDRYRPCPLLRKMAAAGLTGCAAGEGFFRYGADGARR